MFRIRGLYHYYNEGQENQLTALRDINLDIKKGEFLTVIGTNGSGKSTLAKHLNALLLPSRGTVLVKGMDTREEDLLWDIRQTVGMVFQNPDNQIVATTVEEDVAFGPENLGLAPGEIKRRVAEALDIVDMGPHRFSAPHLLSGGQKQRIAIAGVIAMRPECIVLDEPTAMLDPSGRREVMETVLKLNREEGITVVHITHYMDEAVFSQRVLVMEEGRIVLSGKPREIFSQVEGIKRIGLDVPQVTDLASRLKRDGYPLSPGILTVEEMVKELCQFG
ncbi:MAG: energy-coupling factor transporter ATPase [Firmicutes bacterium]|nr:energy-coupling factor transporter ATPase [Bacillota bacterium]